MAKTVVGLFEEQSEAQAAMNDLTQAGLGDNASFAPNFEPELHNRLVEAGIPQGDANLYAEGVQTGHSLIVVQGIADDSAEQAAAILDRHNVLDLSHLSQHHQRQSLQRTTTSTATSGMSANTSLYEGQDTIIPIVEEQIKIGKRSVERGGVRIRTTIEEIPVNEQVTLRDEQVHVERRAVDRVADATDFDTLANQTLEVRETDEEAVVSKEARVVEEVRVRKDVQDRAETVSDTVRRTNVDVEQLEGQTRTTGVVSGSTTTTNASTTQDEGMIERGASRAGNAIEGATGLDIDRDGDVGQRDPRNNI